MEQYEAFIDKDEDIPAYDLSTKLFDVIGLEKSAMQKVHTLYSEDDLNTAM